MSLDNYTKLEKIGEGASGPAFTFASPLRRPLLQQLGSPFPGPG